MQIETSDALIDALRTCGLFSPAQLRAMLRELRPLGDDAPSLMRHILRRDWMSLYQLRKIVHGKAGELHLGPYILTDKLGEGGMGKVYRGQRVADGLPVALKIVRPILLANPIIRARYQREVETALTLKHPNIVEVFDAGEVDGRYYIAMEFVDGIDLSYLVKEFRALEVAEACEYIRQAALGLHHAHQAGFVHRDIKPSNIVVAGERHIADATEPAIVKILDLGLIRSVGFDSGGPEGQDLTRSGTVVGTPDYMAPEQSKNSSAVDHRADLYSLGCTFYFLLAGRPPFPDGNAIEKIIKHQLEAPMPLQALRPDVPTEVAAVVTRLMAKSPADRYPTALAVAEALAPLARDLIDLVPLPRPSGAFRAVSQAPRSADKTATTPVLVGSSDNTPHPPQRTRRRRSNARKDSLSTLNEPLSGEQLPVIRAPQVTPATPIQTNWHRNRWQLVAVGAGLAAVLGAVAFLLARPH